jgi:hypothetical protein
VAVAREQVRDLAEASLLGEVSVARAAAVLVELVREPAGALRGLLSGMEALRRAQPDRQLGPLLAQGWTDAREADRALVTFAAGLPARDDDAVAQLCFGPKIWFCANGVSVGWRSVAAAGTDRPTPRGIPLQEHDPHGERSVERRRTAVDALLDAGLTAAELGRLRLGDLGRLVPGGVFVPDLMSDPLCVRIPGRPVRSPQLTFLSSRGRIAVLSVVLTRFGPDAACRHGGEPVLAPWDGRDAGDAALIG